MSDLTPVPAQHDADAIQRHVDRAVADGLLIPTTPMNPPGQDYRSRTHNAGHLADGSMVDIELRLSRLERPAVTIQHEPIGTRWELSLSGTAYRPRARKRLDRNIEGGGQIVDTFARVIGVTGTKGMIDIWRTFHLNGMVAGCAHVPEPVWEEVPYRRPDLANTPACPETGYRYGHSWLYRTLPFDVVTFALDYLARRPVVAMDE